MKTVLLTLCGALALSFGSGCAGADIGPAGGPDHRAYDVTIDAMTPAIEGAMNEMRWRIEEVYEISPRKYMVTGFYGSVWGNRVSRTYRVQIVVEGLAEALTRVSVVVSDTHDGQGPAAHDFRRTRDQFFRALERQEVVFPS